MRLKVINSFRKLIICNGLKKKGSSDVLDFLSIVVYLFLDEVQELVVELDSEFNSTTGPSAYPRTLVIGVIMFAISKGQTTLKGFASFCEDNKLVNLFISGFNPKGDVYPKLLKKIFLFSLIKLNDYGWLDVVHLFVDGTDALVNVLKLFDY